MVLIFFNTPALNEFGAVSNHEVKSLLNPTRGWKPLPHQQSIQLNKPNKLQYHKTRTTIHATRNS
jgi:hypothetical protein